LLSGGYCHCSRWHFYSSSAREICGRFCSNESFIL